MKNTANINSPHVILWLIIFAFIVVIGVISAEILREGTKRRIAKKRIQREDKLRFRTAEEARRDFR